MRRTAPIEGSWTAVVAKGEDEGTFIARAERYRAGTLLEDQVCTHKHKSGEQAKACGMKLVERLTL